MTQGDKEGKSSKSFVSRAQANDVHVLVRSDVNLNFCTLGLKTAVTGMGTVPQEYGCVKDHVELSAN